METNPTIDAVLTDIVLSDGISGPMFAAKAREKLPALPVVFMSGYGPDSLSGGAKMPEAACFLKKPFRKTDLAKAIHRAMTSQDPAIASRRAAGS